MKYFFNCVHTTKNRVTNFSQHARRTYVLDDHDEEGKLDGKGLVLLDGAQDEVGRDVGAHDLQHGRLNVSVCQSLDVSVSHILVPDLKRL